MDTTVRKPFQGVTNIIRFNWHFYVVAVVMIMLLFASKDFLFSSHGWIVYLLVLFILVSTTISLITSFYVYDLSDLYKLKWLDNLDINPSSKIININAGFDETSMLLKEKYPAAELRVVDFYDPAKHTEVSISRARKAYPAFRGTASINTSDPFLEEKSIDIIFLILAAHEIRDQNERQHFFGLLQKAIKDDGRIIVVEHLRDLPNFLAYTIGFFHFYSERQWKKVFKRSKLFISGQQNITQFITVFILDKNGTAS